MFRHVHRNPRCFARSGRAGGFSDAGGLCRHRQGYRPDHRRRHGRRPRVARAAPRDVVMIIRHGEKPDGSAPGIDEDGNDDDNSLTAIGWQRAHGLVDLFDPARGVPRPGLAVPDRIYAAGATDDGEGQRTRETVAPLATALGIPVDTDLGRGDEKKLVKDILAESGTTLISWQHGGIPTIVDDFPSVSPAPPKEWPDDRFDVVWTLSPRRPSSCCPRTAPASSRTRGTHVHGRDRGRPDRARVRLHQRLPRHGQRDGHLDRDRRAQTSGRRRPGRRAEPRRRLPVGTGRADHLQRSRRRGPHHPRSDLRRPGRGDPLEPGDLAAGPAVQLVARTVRRPDRGDVGVRRIRRDQLLHGGGQGATAARSLADRRRRRGTERHLDRLSHRRARRRAHDHARVPRRRSSRPR